MTNDEIKELLRDLAAKADAAGEVKSRTVRINFSKPEPVKEQEAEETEDIAAPADEAEEAEEADSEEARSEETQSVSSAADAEEENEHTSQSEENNQDLKPAGKKRKKKAGFFKSVSEKAASRRKQEEKVDAAGSSETTWRDLDENPLSDIIPEGENVKRRRRQSELPDFESDAAAFRDTDESQARDEAQIKKTQNGVRQGVGQLLKSLGEKGIGKRELFMIGGGVALLLLILAVVLSILGNKRKSENVTADEGLHITVEREPSSWCKSGTATLKIRSDSPIQTVTVNDAPTDISGETTSTQITLDVDTDVLNVMVVTQDNVKNAVVTLRRVDTEDPMINVSSQDGKITLEASDNKSGVEAIWYGVKEPTIEEAAYTEYKEPFEPEEGKFYSYFAIDNAGNITKPAVTNLTPASKLVLEDDQAALFPGETYELQVKTEPVNAFTNGLVMESANPEIASVDERGVITALADGETDITVSAQELEPVSIHVLVRSSASLTISAVGDITLGEDVSFSPLNSFSTVQTMQGNEYFFENVRDIFEADDVTFGNFEGTLTTSSTRMDKQYAFRGDPSYAQILVDGSIEAVTLANNHSSDYGEQSLTDTQDYLTQAGIEWCSGDKIILKDYNGVKTALIGIYVLAEGEAKAAQVESTIAQAKEQGAQLIVVAFHWGNEKETKPDQVQTSLAHLAIDSGADLVVGHHPHVLQGIEKYSGKYICYSLANFCFGGNSNPSDMDTMIFQQTFELERGGEIRGGEASVIPCLVSSETGWNNYQPTPAQGEEKERILARINELCEPFGTSF